MFIVEVLCISTKHGFRVEDSQNGKQIDFGNKRFHEEHLRELYPDGLFEVHTRGNPASKPAPVIQKVILLRIFTRYHS